MMQWKNLERKKLPIVLEELIKKDIVIGFPVDISIYSVDLGVSRQLDHVWCDHSCQCHNLFVFRRVCGGD